MTIAALVRLNWRLRNVLTYLLIEGRGYIDGVRNLEVMTRAREVGGSENMQEDEELSRLHEATAQLTEIVRIW